MQACSLEFHTPRAGGAADGITRLTSPKKKVATKKDTAQKKDRRTSARQKTKLHGSSVVDEEDDGTETGAIRIPTGIGSLAWDGSVDAYPEKHLMAVFVGMTPENKDDTGM